MFKWLFWQHKLRNAQSVVYINKKIDTCMMLATDSFVEIYIYRFGRRNYLARQSCKIRIPKMVIERPIPDIWNNLPYICIYILTRGLPRILVRYLIYWRCFANFFFREFAIAKTKIEKMKCKYLCEYKACVRTQHQGQYDEKWVLGKCSLLVWYMRSGCSLVFNFLTSRNLFIFFIDQTYARYCSKLSTRMFIT